MEEQQMKLRKAQGMKKELAERRALELQATHPQLHQYSAEPEPSEDMEAKGGGDMGLKRVVGGRKSKKAKKVEEVKEEAIDELSGGGRHQGKLLASHLRRIHGGAYLKDFMMGINDSEVSSDDEVAREQSVKKGRGRPRKLEGRGAGIVHASATTDVPPGGIVPQAYGSPPQSPPSFERNQVGLGRPKKASVVKAVMPSASTDKRKARGQMISKLMKEHGLSLPEASRKLKEMS